MKKKIFVVSDVHGHASILKSALDSAGYEPENENHLLISCGDYFDRGEENCEVLKFFERQKNAVLLRGNHEDLLLKLLESGKILPHHYINGTFVTLENFFGKYFLDPVVNQVNFAGHTRTVDRLCEFIEDTRDFFETENYIFVHGWLPSGASSLSKIRAASAAQWSNARWVKWTEKYDGTAPIEGKTLVCGHMPTFYAGKFDPTREKNSPDIFYGNGLIAIDGGTYDSGRVNVLVLEDNLL